MVELCENDGTFGETQTICSLAPQVRSLREKVRERERENGFLNI